MREKRRKGHVFSKAVFGLTVLICSLTILPVTRSSAADSGAFERQEAAELLKRGMFQTSDSSVKLQEKEAAGGVMLTGDASNLSKAVFTYGEIYDFGEERADYLVVDALAERKKKIGIAFYLDDEKEPFTTVMLAKQKKKEIWSTVKNRCTHLSKEKVTGKHRLSFKVITQETGSLKLVFRSVTFLKNDIPMVEFQLDESQGSIAEMNGDGSHDTECYGKVTLNIPEGYQSEYSDKSFQTETYELDYIRGRGNSTWSVDKKPYKFKLDKKQDLLGMGKNKHWVLLANYYDITMLRNKLTYWLGAQLGMEFTPKCEFVNLVMNGEYLGSYYLCEQIRVGESRVNIDDLEKDESSKTATDEPTISGGYLLSLSPYGDELGQTFVTDRGESFLIESPGFEDYVNEAQVEYIKNYVQKTENAIYGAQFKDENGVSYQDYMDIDSAVDYYWIQEISMNGDAYGSTSTYLYKKRNGKLYWGPLWDFDFVAWGATDYFSNNCSGFTQNGDLWVRRLLDDKVFYQKLVERWPVIKEKLLEACRDGGQIDLYSRKQYESQKHNYEIWKKYSENFGWELQEGNEAQEISYDSEVKRFKDWIKERVDWIDSNLDKLKKEYCSVKFEVDGKVFTVIQVEQGRTINELPLAPEKEGYIFEGWFAELEENGETYEYQISEESAFMKDTVVKAKWIDVSQIPALEAVGFARSDYYIFKNEMRTLDFCTIPFGADSRGLEWKSSDESIVTVEDGMVTAKQKGEAVITVSSPDGRISASCTIHVSGDYEYIDLQSIQFAEQEISISEGSYEQINIVIQPANATLYQNIIFASSDESIVKINSCGYIYGVKEGTAIVACYTYDTGVKFCKVTVTKGSAVTSPPSPTAVPSPTVAPEPGGEPVPTPSANPVPTASPKPVKKVKVGMTFYKQGIKYKILSMGKKKTVSCVGSKNKKNKNIVIPKTVSYQGTTLFVTEIGRKAFANCVKVKQLVIGKNVRRIGEKAFANCKNLKKVKGGKNVKKIGPKAFSNCKKLKKAQNSLLS